MKDGKDFATDTIRKHTGVANAMFSDIDDSSARIMAYITQNGLNILNSRLYCGRVAETKLVEFMGTKDPDNFQL